MPILFLTYLVVVAQLVEAKAHNVTSLQNPNNTCIWKKSVELMPKKYVMSRKSIKRACRWQPEVHLAAEQNNLDPNLLNALILVESAWSPWIVSSANACGLTQVIPKWTGGAASGRHKWSCEQLKKPAVSIAVGARILRWWIDYHAEKIAVSETRPRVKKKSEAEKQAIAIREGLCGYNAGFRGCKRAGNRYAKKVLMLRNILKTANTPRNDVINSDSADN